MVRVTAAIIVHKGRILIARRYPSGSRPGKWEFPGGKIEPGETPEECLAREILEELDMKINVGPLIAKNLHTYTDVTIELSAYSAEWICGGPDLRAHTHIEWAAPATLLDFDLAPADIPIAKEVIRYLSTRN